MPQVKHFGVFAFKPGISAERIDHCFAEMRSMVGRIPGLLDMAHGVYESPEGLDDGFTHQGFTERKIEMNRSGSTRRRRVDAVSRQR